MTQRHNVWDQFRLSWARLRADEHDDSDIHLLETELETLIPGGITLPECAECGEYIADELPAKLDGLEFHRDCMD